MKIVVCALSISLVLAHQPAGADATALIHQKKQSAKEFSLRKRFPDADFGKEFCEDKDTQSVTYYSQREVTIETISESVEFFGFAYSPSISDGAQFSFERSIAEAGTSGPLYDVTKVEWMCMPKGEDEDSCYQYVLETEADLEDTDEDNSGRFQAQASVGHDYFLDIDFYGPVRQGQFAEDNTCPDTRSPLFSSPSRGDSLQPFFVDAHSDYSATGDVSPRYGQANIENAFFKKCEDGFGFVTVNQQVTFPSSSSTGGFDIVAVVVSCGNVTLAGFEAFFDSDYSVTEDLTTGPLSFERTTAACIPLDLCYVVEIDVDGGTIEGDSPEVSIDISFQGKSVVSVDELGDFEEFFGNCDSDRGDCLP